MLFLVGSQHVLWHRYRGLDNSPLVITPINLYASYGLPTPMEAGQLVPLSVGSGAEQFERSNL